MERRLSPRPPADSFKKWWVGLNKDEVQAKMWYKRMKLKEENAKMSDDELMSISEEVKGVGTEQRGRTCYYGFGTMRDELLLAREWLEEDLIEEWKRRVKASSNKIVDKKLARR
jgi:hypothetical protein